jgi:hypothetical protein
MSDSVSIGRPTRKVTRERRMKFVAELARGTDPLTAAKLSGHPAEKALETLSGLGFTLTVLEPPSDVLDTAA